MTSPPETPFLLRPTSLGDLALPHRIVMAPMTRNRAGPGHAPREMNVVYYRQRASAALVLTEATPVEPRGHGYMAIPGMYTDRQEEGWGRVVDAVHGEDGRIFQQLWHAGRVGHPTNLPGDASETVAPSAVRPDGEIPTPEGERPFPEPRALEEEEVTDLVGRFRDAARRARRAGFDGVEPGDEAPSDEGEEHPVVTDMREASGGTVVLNGGYDRESGNRAVGDGRADLVSYAQLFLANPDLPRRFAEGLPLNEPDPDTFYGGDEEGYIDYPAWVEVADRRDGAPGAAADRPASG